MDKRFEKVPTRTLTKADVIAELQAHPDYHGEADTSPLIQETCWDFYLVFEAGAHTARKRVYHTHDEDDRDYAISFWRTQIEQSPDVIRALEVVTVVQTLHAMVVKRDDPESVTACVYEGARNHG